MKVEGTLFVMLWLALLLLELAVFGYVRTNNPWYILSAGISTAALCSAGCLLYVVAGKTPGSRQDYYFYFTDNRRIKEEPFGFLPAAKRK